MSSARRSLDEDDVRVRPGRTKSRARTKERPTFSEAIPATVTAVDRGRFTLTLANGDEVFAVKSRDLGRKGVVVGDHVAVVGTPEDTHDSPMRIVRRDPRATVLRRTADDMDPVERVIVANATRMAIVVATMDPEPRAGLIDRSLVAAWDAGIDPFLIITKIDLKPATELRALYEPLGIVIMESDATEIPDGLMQELHHNVTVVLGHSGVGKSTLVNKVIPESARPTGHVNVVTGRGRHTSTSLEAFPVPGGGILIDTPGIRSFGLAHVDTAHVVHAFPDLEPLTEDCPRACSHREPECALTRYSLAHDEPRTNARIASFQRLLSSMSNEGN